MSDGDFYREHGYVHARGVFEVGEVEEMRAAIERILEHVAGSEHDENHVWSSEREALVLKGFHNLQYHHGAFTRAVAHPRLVALLTELLGPNVQLHHTKMLVKPPEQGASFSMHQDYPYFPHERHTVLAASVHLDDADEGNGCLRVVPGTHLLGRCARCSRPRSRRRGRATSSTLWSTRWSVGRRCRPPRATSSSSTT